MTWPPRDGRPKIGVRGLLARTERNLGCGHEVTLDTGTQEVGVTRRSRRVRSFSERVVAAWPPRGLNSGGAPRPGLHCHPGERARMVEQEAVQWTRARPELGAAATSVRTPQTVVFSTHSSVFSSRQDARLPLGRPARDRRLPPRCPGHPPLSHKAAPPSSSRAALESSQPEAWARRPRREGSPLFPELRAPGLVPRATLLNVGLEASRVSFQNSGRTG